MAKNGKRGDGKRNETTAKAKEALPAGADLPHSYHEPQGNGGETHQTTEDANATLTTQQGVPVADDQNSVNGGAKVGQAAA